MNNKEQIKELCSRLRLYTVYTHYQRSAASKLQHLAGKERLEQNYNIILMWPGRTGNKCRNARTFMTVGLFRDVLIHVSKANINNSLIPFSLFAKEQ